MNHMMLQDNNLKESTLEALGYICEEIVRDLVIIVHGLLLT